MFHISYSKVYAIILFCLELSLISVYWTLLYLFIEYPIPLILNNLMLCLEVLFSYVYVFLNVIPWILYLIYMIYFLLHLSNLTLCLGCIYYLHHSLSFVYEFEALHAAHLLLQSYFCSLHFSTCRSFFFCDCFLIFFLFLDIVYIHQEIKIAHHFWKFLHFHIFFQFPNLKVSAVGYILNSFSDFFFGFSLGIQATIKVYLSVPFILFDS